jgi:hypothetical protein
MHITATSRSYDNKLGPEFFQVASKTSHSFADYGACSHRLSLPSLSSSKSVIFVLSLLFIIVAP